MAADFLSLISAIPSLISNFSGSANPYAKQTQQLAGNQLNASNALMQGPGNSTYDNIFNQYKQQNANNLASTIAEAQGQNRMNANMGRTPLFSQERGSENIFRTLAQQQQGAGVQADQQTRAALGQAGGASLQGLAGYNSILKPANAATAQGLQGYQDIYKMLSGGLGSQLPQTNSNSMGAEGLAGAGNYSLPMGTAGMNGYNTNYNPNQGFVPQAQPYAGYSY